MHQEKRNPTPEFENHVCAPCRQRRNEEHSSTNRIVSRGLNFISTDRQSIERERIQTERNRSGLARQGVTATNTTCGGNPPMLHNRRINLAGGVGSGRRNRHAEDKKKPWRTGRNERTRRTVRARRIRTGTGRRSRRERSWCQSGFPLSEEGRQ